MLRARKTVNTVILLSECSHVFCCVLPTLFSALSLLAGVGMIGSMPIFILELHDLIHAYEVPIIISSGCLLGLGWAVDYYSRRMDCHDTGCAHGPCAPQKNRAHRMMLIATALFLVNTLVYFTLHSDHESPAAASGHHHDHAGHL